MFTLLTHLKVQNLFITFVIVIINILFYLIKFQFPITAFKITLFITTEKYIFLMKEKKVKSLQFYQYIVHTKH